MKPLRRLFFYGYFSLATLPLLWMVATSIKSKADSISIQPKLLPTLYEIDASSIYFRATFESYGNIYAIVTAQDDDGVQIVEASCIRD